MYVCTQQLTMNTCTGVMELCKGLRTNSTLKYLYLTFCNLEEDCGHALGEVLSNSRSSLEVLNLGGNRLKGAGLRGICRGLRSNHTLQKLYIQDNMIDEVRL
jgi:Ran GTPase-activating protein (RanGAP) involved in mRNA processing and transport